MKKIKYGIVDACLPYDGKFGVQFASELGFDGVSLCQGVWKNNLPMSVKRMQDAYLDAGEKYGIEYPSLSVNGVMADHSMTMVPGGRDYYIAVDAIMQAVDTCEAMKISTILVPNFFANGINSEEEMKRAALAYKDICQYALDKNIIISTENVLTRDEYIKFDKMVSMENFKLHFDTQNYWKHRGYNAAQCYLDLHEFCVPQIHLKDGKGFSGSALLGEGDSKFFQTAEAIKSTGFEGWVIFENFYDQSLLAEQNPDPFELIAKDLETAKKTFG